MTRGEGMWANGELLANMLEDITSYYNVNDVVIVAHSNGGKASEVAMFYENKSHLVNRVISLGTPFKGTGLADLAETPALNWLVDFIGLGGGTTTSTTYYMEGVARPILDSEPDNEPNKFINFGGWGWNTGTTITAPVMFIGGTYLVLAGGDSSTGGNDGVTPFYSSTRPGSNAQWPGYCGWWWCNDESRYDHIDITMDYVVWDVITPYFQGNLNNFSSTSGEEAQYERGKVLSSNFEVISTTDGYAEAFKVSKDAGQVSVNVWHPEERDDFVILNEQATALEYTVQKSKGHHKGMSSSIALEELKAGTYTIESGAERFAAVVAYEHGAKLLFDNSTLRYTTGETINFEALLENTTEAATLTAIVLQTTDLMGKAVEGNALVVEFEHLGAGKYAYTLPKGLPAGVYNLTLNAEGSDFRRNLVAGFAVVPTDTEAIIPTAAPKLALSNYPNPAIAQTHITVEVVEQAASQLSLYDAYGRLVRTENLSGLDLGIHTLEWRIAELSNGTYFLRWTNGEQTATHSLVKVAP